MNRAVRAAIGGVLAGLMVTLAAGLPAVAHPEPESPQRITATALEDVVRVVWLAEPDDRATLLYELGIAPESRTFVFDDGQLVPGESDLTDDEVLANSPDAVGGYLIEHIAVSSGGKACTGVRVDTVDIATTGAVIDFECAGPVERAEIAVSTLTDIDPAYETAAVVDSVPGARWNRDVATIVFTFGPDGAAVSAVVERGLDPVVPISIAIALLLLGTTAVVLVRRRRAASNRSSGRLEP